ncbi:unnamed protein product [Symbiodinium sp. CCMP2592]|nr:unnamed protein product [Symbiodinium sp. CCMP2592]
MRGFFGLLGLCILELALSAGIDNSCIEPAPDFGLRVQEAIIGTLLADSFTWHFQGEPPSLTELVSSLAEEEAHSCHGLELLQALRTLSLQGFEFQHFSRTWRTWAEFAHESEPDRGWGPGVREALRNLQKGATPEASAGHYVDLEAAARLPALLLLAEHVDENGLIIASQEMQRVTHENPKVLQAGEFLLRVALELLRAPHRFCAGSPRRAAMAGALRAAAVGDHFGALVDEVLSEAQSRAAVIAAGGLSGKLAEIHSDEQVLGRLTSSGESPGDEVQSAKTSFVLPAILWYVLAYDNLSEALAASAALGGSGGPARAIFIGLLLACRDGVAEELAGQAPPPHLPIAFRPVLLSGAVLKLCRQPGLCQRKSRELNGVEAEAAVLPQEQCGAGRHCYRIFMRFDGSGLLEKAGPKEAPPDWDEEEDGPWTPDEVGANCVARYFQFITQSGRHAPFGLWPADSMCKFQPEVPVWHDSFEVSAPEPLSGLIGGAVLHAGAKRFDVKIPSLSMLEPQRPDWAKHCTHVGRVKLPQGEWSFGAS